MKWATPRHIYSLLSFYPEQTINVINGHKNSVEILEVLRKCDYCGSGTITMYKALIRAVKMH